MKKSNAKYILATNFIESFSYTVGDSNGKGWMPSHLDEAEAAFELLHTKSQHYPEWIKSLTELVHDLRLDGHHEEEDAQRLKTLQTRLYEYCEKHGIETVYY